MLALISPFNFYSNICSVVSLSWLKFLCVKAVKTYVAQNIYSPEASLCTSTLIILVLLSRLTVKIIPWEKIKRIIHNETNQSRRTRKQLTRQANTNLMQSSHVQDMSRVESGDMVQCETELACYLQDCESLIRQLNVDLKVLKDEKYYQVEQLASR